MKYLFSRFYCLTDLKTNINENSMRNKTLYVKAYKRFNEIIKFYKEAIRNMANFLFLDCMSGSL